MRMGLRSRIFVAFFEGQKSRTFEDISEPSKCPRVDVLSFFPALPTPPTITQTLCCCFSIQIIGHCFNYKFCLEKPKLVPTKQLFIHTLLCTVVQSFSSKQEIDSHMFHISTSWSEDLVSCQFLSDLRTINILNICKQK